MVGIPLRQILSAASLLTSVAVASCDGSRHEGQLPSKTVAGTTGGTDVTKRDAGFVLVGDAAVPTTSDSGAAMHGGADAHVSMQQGADSGVEMDASASGEVPGGCGMNDSNAPLDYIPTKILVSNHLTAPCASQDAVILIRNMSDSNLKVESLGVSPTSFSVTAGELPKDMAAGRSMSVHIRFKSKSLDRVLGTIVAKTSAGCKQIPVEGQMVAQSMITPSAYAFDFGDVAAGVTTKPVELTVLVQGEESPGARKTIEGFGSSPLGVFDLVEKPEPPIELGSCDTATVQLTFTAPIAPGAVNGDVSWGFLSGKFSGEQSIPLFGTSVSN
ncbi:MAG TPA: hypothetical protein VFN67_31350 [Polyangiales bacterium]|nr:hypothetical protein [Polyangiales bacterium]